MAFDLNSLTGSAAAFPTTTFDTLTPTGAAYAFLEGRLSSDPVLQSAVADYSSLDVELSSAGSSADMEMLQTVLPSAEWGDITSVFLEAVEIMTSGGLDDFDASATGTGDNGGPLSFTQASTTDTTKTSPDTSLTTTASVGTISPGANALNGTGFQVASITNSAGGVASTSSDSAGAPRITNVIVGVAGGLAGVAGLAYAL